ncbi:MAG: glycolate oxidase subunit GlcE [Clostridia bacterium]
MSLESLVERIRDAAARRAPLRLRGGGSKDFYGNEPRGELLDTRGHAGIVAYEPTELVVTARCGTPLLELEEALHAQGQFLPFEPPRFAEGATVGGCVAAGLSGPRRAAAGAVRDYVLGAKVVDGRGRTLSFGGQVMKNVAGYDVARLYAGSLGTLGLIAEVSLKVLPRPRSEATLALRASEAEALKLLNRWAGQPLALSASAWHDGLLYVRLSGAEAAVRSGAQKMGGERIEAAQAQALWDAIREQRHPFFAGEGALWRLAVPSDAPPLPGAQLIEWGGALRWLRGEADNAAIREAARTAGGHATLFRGGKPSGGVFAPLEPVVLRLHRELKAAFDPAGIFNPGRLVPEL